MLLLLMAIALLLAVYAVARRHRVARIQGTPVLIGEAMKRRGITPADVGAAGLEAARRTGTGQAAESLTGTGKPRGRVSRRSRRQKDAATKKETGGP